MQVKLARDFLRPELLEMGREPLRIEQGEALRLQLLDERPERDLRRPGRAMEHRLAEKGTADRDTIEAAHQLVRRPRFDGVRPAELVQARVALDDLVVDPRVR